MNTTIFKNKSIAFKAALLSFCFPGLGQWYIGQGGVFVFYISVILAFSTGTYDCFTRWDPDSFFDDHFLTWSILGIVIISLIWIINCIDAYFRASRSSLQKSEETQINPWTASFLSLIVPGLGQLFSRRFLLGVWIIILIGFLSMLSWTFMPKHEPEYYKQFTFSMFKHDYWLHYKTSINLRWIISILWISNAIEAFFHANLQGVIPEKISKYITLGRIRNAWPEFLWASGFFLIEFHALDSWWSKPVFLITYLKYWLMYESLAIIAILSAILIMEKRRLEKDYIAAVPGLMVVFTIPALIMFLTEQVSFTWVLLTFTAVFIPRIIHVLFLHTDSIELLKKIVRAAFSLIAAGILLILAFIFWKTVNPWFYKHLVMTHGLYSLGFFFYFILGCVELKFAQYHQPFYKSSNN